MKQVKSNPMENTNKEAAVSYDLEAQVAEVNRQLEVKTKADMELFVKEYEALVEKFKMKLEAKVIITESGGVKAGVDIVLLR